MCTAVMECNGKAGQWDGDDGQVVRGEGVLSRRAGRQQVPAHITEDSVGVSGCSRR